VRSLANDLGNALGCGGYLIGLRRTKSGRFSLRDATPLRKLEEAFQNGNWYQYLIPAAEALGEWPAIELTPEQVESVAHGHRIPADPSIVPGAKNLVRGVSMAGELISLMELDTASSEWQPKKVFYS
jgi:tRNA pseudouridine55 synthase